MSENGNGEVKELLEIKHSYRKNVMELEGKLRADFEKDLADAKKRLRQGYLERIVDVVFAESPPQKIPEETTPVEEKVEEPDEAPSPSTCRECDATLDADAKFCSQCATPVESDEPESVEERLEKNANVTKVASASRKRSIPVR